jgi:hypothetical protein
VSTRLLARLFAIDCRSLAAFRIGLGSLLILDLAKRSLALAAHYSDAGVLPRAAALAHLKDPTIFRLHMLGGSPAFEAVLFVVAALVALAFTLGYRTRLAAAVSFFLLVSLQLRNPLVCHAGDSYLTALMFWAMLLPTGACCSLDRRRAGASGALRPILSVATAAILIQIGVFYVSAGLLKYRHAIWRDGSAMAYFLAVETYTTPLGEYLAGFPALAQALTYLTLAIEIALPALLFSPYRTQALRALVLPLFGLFHVSINLVVHIGLFQLASLVALLCFVPPAFWERARSRARGSRPAETGAAARGDRVDRRPPATILARTCELMAAVSLAVVLWSNVRSVAGAGRPELPGRLGDLALQAGLVQRWEMFTGIETQPRGWFVVAGELANGAKVDVLARAPFTGLARPADFAARYSNHNWRRYWNVLALELGRVFRPDFADYLCRSWNAGASVRLESLAVLHAYQEQPGTAGPPKVDVLVTAQCPR